MRRRARWAVCLVLSPVLFACGSGDPSAAPAGPVSSPSGAATATSASSVPRPASEPAAAQTVASETTTPSLAPGAPDPAPDLKPSLAPATGSSESSCDPNTAGSTFEEGCVACAGSDACASCLCSACTDEVELCMQTAGCMQILACARTNGCSNMTCYCGSADTISCLNGNADGACRDLIESAPGGHAPSVRDPSGGPATDRASALAQCLQKDKTCRSTCAVP